MIEQFQSGLAAALGLNLDPKDLSLLQVSLRAVIVFIVTLVIIRLGDKRFLAKNTAFDAIVGFLLASMLARAINGTAPFFATLGGGFVIVGLHRLVAALAFHHHAFGTFVKGTEEVLVRQGEVIDENMRRNHITQRDLLEELRLNGNVNDPKEVWEAHIERNGQISVIHRAEAEK